MLLATTIRRRPKRAPVPQGTGQITVGTTGTLPHQTANQNAYTFASPTLDTGKAFLAIVVWVTAFGQRTTDHARDPDAFTLNGAAADQVLVQYMNNTGNRYVQAAVGLWNTPTSGNLVLDFYGSISATGAAAFYMNLGGLDSTPLGALVQDQVVGAGVAAIPYQITTTAENSLVISVSGQRNGTVGFTFDDPLFTSLGELGIGAGANGRWVCGYRNGLDSSVAVDAGGDWSSGDLDQTAGMAFELKPAPGGGEPAQLQQLGAWELDEASGTNFSDDVGSNPAILTVPTWTVDTHVLNRPAIKSGADGSIEVSNGGPAIPMAAGYKQSDASLVLHVGPLSEMRGTQYWDESDARWGREFLAFCDDGSTPGSFAIERRLVPSLYDRLDFSTRQFRLDGYVRNASGTAVRFSGGLDGISGATLPVDVSKRITLAQGASGAKLYLDNALVASLPEVTTGWTNLTSPIYLGSSSSTGHANDRSPFWGRLGGVEVWQGQLGATEVAARPAAITSLRYRIPSDGPLINVANYGGDVLAAFAAAASASGYLYQDAADTNWYTVPPGANSDRGIQWSNNCRGLVGCKLILGSTSISQYHKMVTFWDTSIPGGYGSYKIIGCQFDGNGRGRQWHPKSGQAGYTYTDFDLQQSHAIMVRSLTSGRRIPVTVDACEFHDGTGDAVSCYNLAAIVVASCRFYGYFRGPLVINSDADVYLEAKRFESFSESRKRPGVFNGCGLCDCEGFGGDPDDFGYIRLLFADGWAESDFDEASRQHDSQRKSWTRLYGCHTTGAAFQFKHDSSSDGWAAYPISEVFSKYCTWSYWRRGHGGGNFPPSLLGSLGPGDAGLGLLCEGTVFIANGDPYCHHEDSLLYTTNDLSTCEITYLIAASNTEPGGRKVTLHNCEFRVKNLPAGLTTANTRCFWWPATFPAAFELEFDGVLIDSAFADTPFNLGGATIRYRNVLHERTNDTTPWTNYTSEILIT